MTALDAEDLSSQGQDVLAAAVRRNQNIIAARARENPAVFAAHVLRDERTGRRIKLSPTHEEWHDLIDTYDRLVLWSHIECGKTQQLSIGRPLWELGRDPNKRVAIVSKTKSLAMKIVRACGQLISRPGPIHEVFPHLRPASDPSLPWTSLALTVERPAYGAKDPSIQACGNFGNVIGSRIDFLILDDVLDSVNTRTPAPRAALWEWLRGTLLGRLTADGRVLVNGNAWHPDDLMHRLEREPRFKAFRFPVMNAAGQSTWPDRWSLDRIEKAKDDLGPLDYARQLLCQPRDDDSARFKREWVEMALTRGVGLSMLATRADLLDEFAASASMTPEARVAALAAAATFRLSGIDGSGIRIYIGVDLAVQQHSSADLTAMTTVALMPDGTRRLLSMESGRWGAPEILARIEALDGRYKPEAIVVENVGAQDYILQMMRHRSTAPVVPYTTGKQKAHPEFGIEAIANELATGRWTFPCESESRMHREIFALCQEILGYDPKSHTGDRLMSMWFAQIGIRGAEAKSKMGGGGARVRVFTGED